MAWCYFEFARAVRDSELPSVHKAILWALALRADPMGSCYPGQKLIGHDSGVHERHVRRVLPELLGGPFVTAVKSPGRSAVYQLMTPDKRAAHPGSLVTPDTRAARTPEPGSPDTRAGVPRTPEPHTPDTRAADLPIELPKEEPKKKPKRRGPRGTRVPEDWKPTEATVLWCRKHGLAVEEIPGAAEEFIDFWTARVPDGKEVKTAKGWQAAFKNRIRGGKYVNPHPSYREREIEILPPKPLPLPRKRKPPTEGAELLRKVAAGEMAYEQLPAAMQSPVIRAKAEREIARLRAEMGGQQQLAIGGAG